MVDSPGYSHVLHLLAADEAVILDGGVATELERALAGEAGGTDERLWGTWALYRAPHAVLDVHRRYVEVGCDVVSTNTWAILAPPEDVPAAASGATPVHWMEGARLGVRLARRAVAEAGREASCAVAFTVNAEVDRPGNDDKVGLLGRVFESDAPDLILVETLTLIREDHTLRTIDTLLELGLPVWLSFRRCRHGVCGVYGEHWGGPEGDLFGRAARAFEDHGVGALLLNCLPASHVTGMLSWLRDFTDLPLGVYPNLGHFAGDHWRFDERVTPAAYAELALAWREEGAQIVGGCCGVTPDHIAAVRAALAGTKPGRARPAGADIASLADLSGATAHMAWTDPLGRELYPLPLPELTCDPGVFVPTQGSFLLWRYLFQNRIGAGQSCLDVGCGCGILAVQLALNDATHVHAIDIDRHAVANTLANAFRNAVADRISGADVDLYGWEPPARYDVVVASLYQMPVDPFTLETGHRPADFWGRSLLDHLLSRVPELLAPGGAAYVMQLSILSRNRTAELLHAAGLTARVVDFGFFPFSPLFFENEAQIRRVEELSDAFHVTIADQEIVVAYLLEVRQS